MDRQECESSPRGRVADKRREKPLVKDLNDHIVCPLCRGYLIDAATLVECLHSFCRGCITRRLQCGPKNCPVCSATVQSPPVTDVGLQRLVYLVVPGLFRSEQERRRQFYQSNPQSTGPSQPPIGAPDLGFDDLVSLSLCELDSTSEAPTRYLKCPAGVSVRHLLRLLMLKRGWDDTEGEQRCAGKRIEMLYELTGNGLKNDFEVLNPSWTLMDLACIFEWKREAPMKLLYRIVQADEPLSNKPVNDCCVSISSSTNSSSSSSSSSSGNNSSAASPTTNTEPSSQAIENIQRPPTPPPSPKPAISRTDSMEKGSRPAEQYPSTKELESKKPRCEVTPVMRAPDPPPPIDEQSKSSKPPKLEHQHKRKKHRNKRVIAEITTTPREDLLKLKVRLTPCPPRVTSSSGTGSQSKDKLVHIRAMRKEKSKSSQKHRLPKEHKSIEESIEEKEKSPSGKEEVTEIPKPPIESRPAPTVAESEKPAEPVATEASPTNNEPEKDEPPKNEEVLRRLGLVAISEANKTRPDQAATPAQTAGEKSDPAVEREKLEKQLRESKANRVRSLLAEKQMRDTLKSIMSKETSKDTSKESSKETSTSKETSKETLKETSKEAPKEPAPTGTAASTSSIPATTATQRSATPTAKRKEPPPLTPLRSAKRPNVTFAPSSFSTGKYESPLDLSSPSSVSKDNALDLSSSVGEVTVTKCVPKEKPVGILRTSAARTLAEKPKEDTTTVKKTHDSNLRTLSDAAVSLLGGCGVDQVAKIQQSFMGPGAVPGIGGKVALRIPQPHQRITGFGMKIKPSIGVRHIPNPQAVVASQYRNQRTGFFNLAHKPP